MESNDAILTDVFGKPGGFWRESTTLVGIPRADPWLSGLVGSAWAGRLQNVRLALRLLWRRHQARGIVTEGGLDGLLFAILQALLPWGRKPHVLVDCCWYLPKTRLGRRLRSWQLQLAARSARQFVVWAAHEVDDYAEAFGIPRDRFVYVPFHDTLTGYAVEERDDGYLFGGGNYDRDYRTLVEAVRPLHVPVWIATTLPGQLAGLDLPPRVRVEGTTAAGFRQAMAAARLVVVPMQKGLLHSGGQQTCLNAMRLGKPTIAVGRAWAKDLVADGVNGLIVDYEDVTGLRQAIRWVIDHPEAARQMAERGRAHAAQFTARRCMESIYHLALSAGTPGCTDYSAAEVCRA